MTSFPSPDLEVLRDGDAEAELAAAGTAEGPGRGGSDGRAGLGWIVRTSVTYVDGNHPDWPATYTDVIKMRHHATTRLVGMRAWLCPVCRLVPCLLRMMSDRRVAVMPVMCVCVCV